MRLVFVSPFLAFISIIHYSESFSWTEQPANPTLVTKGKDESLAWKFSLTADEQAKSQTFYLIKWKKFNQANSNYDQIAGQTFVSVFGTIVYTEPRAPHIEVDKNETATLLINNVRTADEGTYKIECSLQPDGTVLADHEVNFTILEPPEVVVSDDQDVCEGSTVTLSCNATGKPTPNITWTKEGENGTDSGPLTSVKGFYVISTISRSSSGTYRCTASNGAGDPVNKTTKVILGNSSSVDGVVISSNTAIEDHPYKLSCEVSGVPMPSVSWIKVRSGERHAGKLLHFTSISRNDAGDYTCEANNRCGNDSQTKAINVFFKPVITQFKTSAANHTTCQNNVIKFYCTASANPSVTSYQLFENDTAILDTDTPSMWSRNMSTSGVFLYKCVANNTYGTGSSEMIPVRVYDPPFMQHEERKIVKEGDSISVYCDASGVPAPIVSWRKVKSGDDVVNGHSLNISDISRCQGGEYRCTASNTCGTKYGTVNIDVQYGPYIVSSKHQIVKEGHCVTLSCPVLGNPPPDITWYKGDNIGVVISNESVLQFPLASTNFSGWYICHATSYLGNVTTSVFLEIEKLVESTPITSRITTSSASESTEVYLTATIRENCSRRGEVAAKFPEMACQIAFRFGCSSANTVNTRCGSVVLDFMMRFNQSVVVSHLLTLLSDSAKQDKFGFFKVDRDSIKQVFISTDDLESTKKGPEECNCRPSSVLLTIIGVLVIIIFLLVIYIIRLHRKGAFGKQRTYEDERSVYDNEIRLQDVEPSRPDSGKLTQLPTEYMELREASRDNRKAPSAAQGADYAPLRPLTRSWEVPRHHVTIEKVIGKGAFGQVAKGTAVRLRGKPETTTVAIKMLKSNAAESEKRDLMNELETIKQLKPHPYVIKLLGCITESEPLLVLIEYVPFGDLLGYLRKSRGLNDTYYKDPNIKPQTNLTAQQLLKFAWQIADGMSYLSSKSIIHRDLAARNVLVGQKETCKVTDFGMARDVQEENIYERKTKGRLPVKWTAYEALLYGKHTTKSDVWSYGVVLYEIFTIGGSPYPRMDGRKIANLLQEGYRMPKPEHIDEKLYQIMMKCWKNDPDGRPTFTELKNQLKDMETQHKRLINMSIYDRQLYANVEDLLV